jgi:hypothetical protein
VEEKVLVELCGPLGEQVELWEGLGEQVEVCYLQLCQCPS